MISCPGCGQGMRFDPSLQMMYCDYCTTKLDPEVVTVGAAASESDDLTNYESTLFTCPQCGGEILSDNDTAITFCSYCGLSVELKGRTVKMRAPSHIIPFKCAKSACTEKYKEFIKKAIYAPSYLREDTIIDKIRGIYMPYWTYKMEMNAPVSYEGTTSHRSGDYIITEHYLLTSRPEGIYEGIAYDASSSFSDELSQAVGPFNVRDSKPFSVAYTAGFYADTADVDSVVYEDDAKKVIACDIDTKVRKIPDFSRYSTTPKPDRIESVVRTTGKDMSYFPVYFLANRHNNGLVSYAVINGQTGKVAADIPIDYKKYLLGSVILAIPIMIILDFFLVLRPDMLTLLALIFAVISMLITNSELNQIYTRNLNLNDQGLLDAQNKKSEADKLRESQAIMQPSETEKVNANLNINVQNLSITGTKKNYDLGESLNKVGKLFAVAGFVVFYLAIEISEPFVLLFGLLFFAIGMIMTISGSSMKKSLNNGSSKVSVATAKQPFKEKLPVLIKPIIAIVFGILLLIVKPYQDEINYAFSFVIMGIVLFTFFDIVKLHNKLTLRKPKQFNKRGGDENV